MELRRWRRPCKYVECLRIANHHARQIPSPRTRTCSLSLLIALSISLSLSRSRALSLSLSLSLSRSDTHSHIHTLTLTHTYAHTHVRTHTHTPSHCKSLWKGRIKQVHTHSTRPSPGATQRAGAQQHCQALGAAADECSMNVFDLCRKKPGLLTPSFRGGDTRCTNGVGCKRSASSSLGGSAGASLRSGAAVAGGHGTLPMSSTGSV